MAEIDLVIDELFDRIEPLWRLCGYERDKTRDEIRRIIDDAGLLAAGDLEPYE